MTGRSISGSWALDTKRLVLGTAQLVRSYGAERKILKQETQHSQLASEILDKAQAYGVSKLDTAPSYGDAERFIGLHARERFKIQSKFSAISRESVTSQLRSSLTKLQLDQLESAILHDPFNLTSVSEKALIEAKGAMQAGLVRNLGVSIYSELDLQFSVSLLTKGSTLQLPGNIFMEALWFSPEMLELRSKRVSFQLRSLFMQGMLVKNSPIKNRSALPNIEKARQSLQVLAKSLEVDVKTILLLHATAVLCADEIVIGVSHPAELQDLYLRELDPGLVKEILEGVKQIQREVRPSDFELNPKNW